MTDGYDYDWLCIGSGPAGQRAAVQAAKQYLSYFQGPLRDWQCADQRLLRQLIPENRLRVYDIRQVIETLADQGSMLELRRQFARLSELGEVRFERRTDAEGLECWVDEFLALEHSGWKGSAGSALASHHATAQLFREALAGAAAQQRLEPVDRCRRRQRAQTPAQKAHRHRDRLFFAHRRLVLDRGLCGRRRKCQRADVHDA